MHSILLIGNPDHLGPFLDSTPGDQGFVMIASAVLAYAPDDWVHDLHVPGDIAVVIDLTIDRALKERVLAALVGRFGPDTIYISNALTMTATEAAARIAGRLSTTIPTDMAARIAEARVASGLAATAEAVEPIVSGISYVPHIYAGSALLETAPALGVAPEHAERTVALLRELTSKEIEIVGDRVGLVAARTLAMIVNEGAFALMEGVAGAADIDTAMKLGTNYPEGPLKWADQIGPDIILAILHALHDEYAEERYRPCVLLKQLARAGKGFGILNAEV